jgi:hypothetical protein
MAGIIVADTIQSGGSFIRLNSASQTVATINASGIYANTGNLLIAANGTIGVASITNTAITGTMTQAQIGNAVAGTGPAFRAVLSGNQTIAFNIYTKLTLSSEIFDTASCYDPTTNYRFTPNVAGYYQVSLQILCGGTATRSILAYAAIYKNGSVNPNSTGGISVTFADGADNSVYSSGLIYMNGTTDYLEAYIYQYDYSANSTLLAKAIGTNFNACLVRAA